MSENNGGRSQGRLCFMSNLCISFFLKGGAQILKSQLLDFLQVVHGYNPGIQKKELQMNKSGTESKRILKSHINKRKMSPFNFGSLGH